MKNEDYSKTDIKPWRVLSTKPVYKDSPWVELSSDHVVLPNGIEIPDFYQIKLHEYIAVFARTNDGYIVMEHQYKHAPEKVIINLPSGYLNKNETPLEAAKRELYEETGFTADKWYYLGAFFVDGNRGCGKLHAFAADKIIQESEPCNEETEEVEVIFVKPEHLLNLLSQGEIPIIGSALTIALALLLPGSPYNDLTAVKNS